MSAYVKWGKKFELEIEEIDAQHKKWIEILNRFVEAREQGKEARILNDVLKEIVDYTRYHFDTEEKHMKENDYALLEEHKQQHAILIKQVAEIIRTINVSETKAILSLEMVLKNWVLKHILTYDKMYGEFLKRKRKEKLSANS